MELRFDPILYSKLGNANFDSGHIKRLCGPQFPNPCSKSCVCVAYSYSSLPP